MRALPSPAAAPDCGPLLAQQLTDALRKRLDTCRAHCAWHFGIVLEAIEADDGALEFVASIHALTRRFRSVPEIEGWIAALDALDAPRHEVARFIGAREATA